MRLCRSSHRKVGGGHGSGQGMVRSQLVGSYEPWRVRPTGSERHALNKSLVHPGSSFRTLFLARGFHDDSALAASGDMVVSRQVGVEARLGVVGLKWIRTSIALGQPRKSCPRRLYIGLYLERRPC
jgi:hypothetical protein